ncbi:trinucleotide repeat-containing gene 6C protein isoform X1, partial [Tachysurus ichikawai]
PDSAKPSPAPLPPANPSTTSPSVPSASSSGANGKRAPSSTQQQPQSAVQRYPPREVPPRFRQHEHKQLLKRGQPLPPGNLAVVLPSSSSPTVQSFPSQSHPGQQLVQYTHPSF